MTLDDLFDPAPTGPDAPRAGLYQLLQRGRPAQPVAIWFGPPMDPLLFDDPRRRWPAEPLDRSWRWNMLLNDEPVGIDPIYRGDERRIWTDVWPQCSGSPLTRSAYGFLVASIRHAREFEPDHPFAQPDRKVDFRTVPLPFA